MGFFSNFFGLKSEPKKQPRPPGPASAAQLKFNSPYELIEVPGKDAVKTCLRLRADYQKADGWPVILGGDEDAKRIFEAITANKSSAEQILKAASKRNAPDFFRQRQAANSEHYRKVEKGEWPAKPEPLRDPSTSLVAHLNRITHQPMNPVYLAKIPTPRAFETPAWLKMGNWKNCPAPEDHAAVMKYWQEQYGAEIISLTGDIIECTVSRPPETREAAETLAFEQFVYCSNIVYQSAETLRLLAAALLKGKTWYFWWD